jgi:uncharacterized protein (TIGR00661 family)
LNFDQNLILKNVLIAPLDWGLGHATRCIPIIKSLQQAGYTVTVAAASKPLALLQQEFPGIPAVTLFGYNVSYSTQKRFLALKILWQSPKILLTVWREHVWLKKLIRNENFSLVISDNRFGLYTSKIPCIFVTHQLLIKAGVGWLEWVIQKINYHFINKYTACWVPDFEGESSIAGELSHPVHLPRIPLKYLGPLSRFAVGSKAAIKYTWMVILSGPEPQRTILEQKILALAADLQGQVLLVRGKPGDYGRITAPQNCTVVNHLSTAEMQHAFAESAFIVSRCGYTTVMEVLAMQKKALLIPTPGQTEQEYLAVELFNKKWCYTCQQSDDLLYHIKQAQLFNYSLPVLTPSSLNRAVEDVKRLIAKNQALG